MIKITSMVTLAMGLVFAPSSQGQDGAQENARDVCIQRCKTQPLEFEVQRQEIISLEREAARAIQLNNGTYFQRVYNDDFAGILSHGQLVNKTQWIAVIESPTVKYESFNASDIKVRIYEDTAVATCLWSSRSIVKGQHIGSQIRAIHVYVDTPRGWHVVLAQTTNLPPDVQQPL
jgi:hypothetical protein